MKFISILAFSFIILSVSTVANAVSERGEIQRADRTKTVQLNVNTEASPTASPATNTIRNQDKVKPVVNKPKVSPSTTPTLTEEDGAILETDPTESSLPSPSPYGSKKVSPRSETALQHMSVVAQRVQEMLQNREEKGGIGDQVRLIAREQNRVQDEIETELEEVDNRSELKKRLVGPDYSAISEIQTAVDENEARILELQTLMAEMTDETEIAETQALIDAIELENDSLMARIQEETSSFSFFGWFFRRLATN